ncbi:putative efflux pump periplasmic linker protein [Sphingobium sp. SYK-6]|uniref:efflux RND transporter periplasmic adaptor subunit n=1 Tax=Sphingobium sp. (strain NBRC 103272 / SYK-6) TaxID=627192 RepID=UPI0002277A7D|nr:efflux RND transporter periplasmic adaptor subunit [Sphingobium sp. SYK-6]BAK68136.1 putative efflux pump periplasmic linker protein [Sphingobium sp. SYK-6]
MNMHQLFRQGDARQTDEIPAPSRARSLRRAAWIALPVLAVAGIYGYAQRGGQPAMAQALPTVTVSTPLQREVTEWDDYIGRFEASRSVEVRPRVSGAITALHFTDGQIVRAGQPLFTIDQRPFQAALAEARAGVATAQSDLALARTDLERAQRLIEVDAVSQSEVDRLRARVQAATAALAGAQARTRSRALDLEFTTVRAPISGRISDRRIDPGNLVSAGDGASGTLLTTINALDPIYFTFEGSEGLFLKQKREGNAKGAAVQVRLQDESDYRWAGKLDFTDNGLDPRSGTIRARAVIANPDMFLTPGMFGNMRLASGTTVKAMLVPDTAVQTDQARKLLLVVGKDGTVAAKPVTLGPVIDGLRVVRGGIEPSDRVVIVGTQMAMPGGKVQATTGKIEPEAHASAASSPTALPLAGQATFAR